MAQPRGDARREARPGEPERGVEAQAALQLVADRLGRAHRWHGAVRVGAQVDEGLVGRRPLDAPARGEQHGRHLLADAAVGVEIAAAEGRLGCDVARLQQRHAGANARALGLLARRRHEAAARAVAADHDRPAAQGGVEASLDRDEERVEVDVQDEAAPLLHAIQSRSGA